MTGLVRRASLFCAVGLTAASAAMAGVPSATTSTQVGAVRLVGQSGGVADVTAAITYVIRDAANNPVPGSTVILNFSGCTDSRLSNTVFGAGIVTNCAAKTVTGVTNAAGQVVITVAGAGGLGAVMGTKCVAVTADGVPFSNIAGATADYNALGGVDALDISTCGGDVFSIPYQQRSDFSGDGSNDALDISVLGSIVFSPGSDFSVPTFCP